MECGLATPRPASDTSLIAVPLPAAVLLPLLVVTAAGYGEVVEAGGADLRYAGGRLTKVAGPPDVPGGPRAETAFVYHADGRLDTAFGPDGTGVSYDYDAAGRRVKTTYSDGTTEEVEYAAAGPDAGLIVKEVDRAGVVTELAYDGAGRLVTRTEAAAVRDGSGNDTPTPAGTALVTTYEYLEGTTDVARAVRGGSETLYQYDGRGRLVASTVRPNAATTLTTTREYRGGQLFKTTDPYGRGTYHAYDACCGRKIRTVVGAVPSFTLADGAAVLAHTRDPDGTPNSLSLVSDVVYDAAGQVTSTVDPRGVSSTYAHDSVGRRVAEVEAAGTPVEARTETDYDLAGNVTEVRGPRFFDPDDAAGQNAAKTTMTYTGRDLLASRTEAPGTPVAATVSYSYRLDGELDTKTDERGNVWTSYEDDCCERHTASANPLDEGTITNKDPRGLVTHTAAVANVSQQADYDDPADADTLSETTTRYDARGRPVARTVWLAPLGSVDPADPPIAADPANGLTSTWAHDDDLTDGAGLDADFAQHLAGLNLGAGAAGSGTLATNAAGERTLSLSDGAGRTVRTVQLASDDSALTQSTRTYDAVATVAGYGEVVETTGVNLRGDGSTARTDAAGRTLESADAAGNVSTFAYDAAGNVLASRDPNGVGRDCTYDALGRDVSCTDTAGALTTSGYDLAGNLVSETDAKGAVTTHAHDARGRQTATTDRLGHVTAFAYDPAGNLLSLTDAEGGATAYAYDDAGRKASETYPDHVPGSAVGAAGYGIVELAYDAAGRLLRRTDQLGDTVTHVYDLAGRRTVREYRTAANSPAGTIADRDEFSYDAAGRILSATKGRYANVIGYAYDDGGRIASEFLTVGGQTYTIGRGYDDAGHLGRTDLPGRHGGGPPARRPRPAGGGELRRLHRGQLRLRRRRPGDDPHLRQRPGHDHLVRAGRQPAGVAGHAERRHVLLQLRREQEPDRRSDRGDDERLRVRHGAGRLRRGGPAGELGPGGRAAGPELGPVGGRRLGPVHGESGDRGPHAQRRARADRDRRGAADLRPEGEPDGRPPRAELRLGRGQHAAKLHGGGLGDGGAAGDALLRLRRNRAAGVEDGGQRRRDVRDDRLRPADAADPAAGDGRRAGLGGVRRRRRAGLAGAELRLRRVRRRAAGDGNAGGDVLLPP